ncbi:MAG TPA: hypothetical protein VK831_02605 [Candidatus Deferrimicrobiaceae bacterium]|nr:hypothetical protein [Candidatus Deferrimicrobiaceae bacterium]
MIDRLGDGGEIEALVTDRYLDSLLAGATLDDQGSVASEGIGAAVRAASRRLANDLPRFHPSFRFEERLALRLAELAASMRLPLAAGGEGQPIPITAGRRPADAANPADQPGTADDWAANRPLLIGGAFAASAISLAGAWLAWRRRAASPMARAVRAAHARGAGPGA